MAYASVDALQKALVEEVFHYAKDSKKAAGRALGTIVEVITYYLLRSWGLSKHIAIERGLVEYGNPTITHNVEFSLHPSLYSRTVTLESPTGAISSPHLLKVLNEELSKLTGHTFKKLPLIDKKGILRNACTIAISDSTAALVNITKRTGDHFKLEYTLQHRKPFAMFECKRVGVEEGMKKGPQTIEKAKQGAYVARTASSLQKIRTEKGEMHGIIYRSDDSFIVKPYADLLEDVIYSNDAELLRRFILTVGVVSNHGNWFTSDNQNKEMRVLSQSYDWLLFLTDNGLAEFIETLIRRPDTGLDAVKRAFLSSYSGQKGGNKFTKVQMNLEADAQLREYFKVKRAGIEKWFNVITPDGRSMKDLKDELQELQKKDWVTLLR